VKSKNEILMDDFWICDSGACGHYCELNKCLFDVKDNTEKIIVGNGESMKAIKVGSLKCHVIQLNGSSVDATLKEVKYVPELWVNLFSVSKSLNNGFNLSNKGLMIILKKGSVSVTFDRVMKTVNGSISGIKMTIYDPSVTYTAKGSLTAIKNLI
jgi:ribosomal protein L30E